MLKKNLVCDGRNCGLKIPSRVESRPDRPGRPIFFWNGPENQLSLLRRPIPVLSLSFRLSRIDKTVGLTVVDPSPVLTPPPSPSFLSCPSMSLRHWSASSRFYVIVCYGYPSGSVVVSGVPRPYSLPRTLATPVLGYVLT